MAKTNAQRQADYRARRNEAAKKWEQMQQVDNTIALRLPTDDRAKAIELFNDWLTDTYGPD